MGPKTRSATADADVTSAVAAGALSAAASEAAVRVSGAGGSSNGTGAAAATLTAVLWVIGSVAAGGASGEVLSSGYTSSEPEPEPATSRHRRPHRAADTEKPGAAAKSGATARGATENSTRSAEQSTTDRQESGD